MFIASVKIPEREGSISITIDLLITIVSPIYLVDEFQFLFLLLIPLRSTQQRAGWCNLVCVECSFVDD